MVNGSQRLPSPVAKYPCRVEHQRRAALLPSDSDARPPNRTCTFRYASGSPGTQMYAGVRIQPLRKRSTLSMERRNCSTLPSRHSLRVGRRRLGSLTSRVLLRWSFLCFFIYPNHLPLPDIQLNERGVGGGMSLE